MAFKHGRNTVVLYNQYDMTAFLNASDTDASVDNPITTTYSNSGVRRQVVGLQDGKVTFGGYHDTGATHPVFTAALGAASAGLLSLFPEGTTIALPVTMLGVRAASYKASEPVDAVVTCTAEFDGDGPMNFGVSLHSIAAAESGTGDSTGVDYGAATTNGGVAHIHVKSITSTPTATVKVQHSSDDVTYADLVTFSSITGVTSERVEVAAGTTVNRYTRETRSALSGGTITYAVAFARR
jgi:hypothetical protein